MRPAPRRRPSRCRPSSNAAPSSTSRSTPARRSSWAARLSNLLFAFVLLTAVFFFAGEPYSPPTVAVQADGPAAKAGLRTGDEIVRLGDKNIDRYEDIQDSQFLYWAKPMAVEYRRGGQLLNTEIVPQFCERTDKYNNTLRFGELGMDQLVRPVVGGFTASSPAEAAGLKVGDLLLEIDGKPVDYFSHIPELIGSRAGQPVTVKYDRDGKRDEATVVPVADKALDCAGKEHVVGRLRVRPAGVTEFRSHGLVGAMGAGVRHVWSMTTMFYTSMAQILTATRPVDELGGPIRIAKAAGEASYAGWTGILNLVIALSIVLGVFNLLPGADARWRPSRDVSVRGGARQAAQPQDAGVRPQGRLCSGDRHGADRDFQRH